MQNIQCYESEVSVEIIYPEEGAIVSGKVWIVILLWYQEDPDRVELYIDDSLELITYILPFNMFWDSTSVSDGSHEIKVIAYDVSGNSGSDIINVKVMNEPWVEGPLNGITGEEYTYYIRGTEYVEAEELYGYFDWGDGSNTGWIGPYYPGDDIYASHIWSEAGIYELEIQLKNETGLWIKAWATTVIIRKRSRPIVHSIFLQLLERFPFLERLFSLL